MFEKEAEEYVTAFTDRSHIWSNDKLMQLQLREAYKDGAELGCKKANEELEEKISVLLSCKNCPENKDGLIRQKEYEGKCLAQKIQYIKELQQENAELKAQIEKKMEEIRTDNTETLKNALGRIAELEKEKAELKEQCSIFDKSLVTSTKNNIERQKIIDEIKEQLTEAKKIIEKLLDNLTAIDGEQIRELKVVREAEQFLKELENEKRL